MAARRDGIIDGFDHLHQPILMHLEIAVAILEKIFLLALASWITVLDEICSPHTRG